MKRAFLASAAVLLSLLIVAAGCGSSGDLTRAETQRQFGVRMAKMNLWREAMFRFQREVDLDPNDAMAHNNLAVACEANGDYDTAAKEYREALRLDRSNQYIQKNYSRFVEFMQKSRKPEAKPAEPATATSATGAQPAPAPASGTEAEAPAATPPDTTTATTTNPPDRGDR